MNSDKKKVVMVEHMDDVERWAWYAVIDDCTPEQALRWYASEHGLTVDSIISIDGELYLNTDNGDQYESADARAYEISIMSITK